LKEDRVIAYGDFMKNNIVTGTTCFSEHKKRNLSCKNNNCRLWMESAVDLNCTVIASESGEYTLQAIGDKFGLTRMRICQLEKEILVNLRRLKQVRKSS
jgi:hypothetical protein